ncbi:MAG: hypothetical protein QNL70_13430 [Pseudomonas sp.]
MLKTILFTAGVMAASVAFAYDEGKVEKMPPESPFVQVSEVLPLPAFLPGLGTLFVDPDTLPAGPFLGYDHDGKLSATIYMIPLGELEKGVAYDDLDVGLHEVTSVDVYYNAGHPGVEVPHAHVVLYHDAGAEERLAK